MKYKVHYPNMKFHPIQAFIVCFAFVSRHQKLPSTLASNNPWKFRILYAKLPRLSLLQRLKNTSQISIHPFFQVSAPRLSAWVTQAVTQRNVAVVASFWRHYVQYRWPEKRTRNNNDVVTKNYWSNIYLMKMGVCKLKTSIRCNLWMSSALPHMVDCEFQTDIWSDLVARLGACSQPISYSRLR